MGGLDLSVAFESKKHDDGSLCEYAKHDKAVQEFIGELTLLMAGSDSSEENSLEAAKKLNQILDKFEQAKYMQLFKEGWPTARLSEEESTALMDKAETIVNAYDNEELCEACRKNTFCLAFAPFLALQCVAEDYASCSRTSNLEPEQVAYLEALDGRVQTLQDRAVYIQSRTNDLYYGGYL